MSTETTSPPTKPRPPWVPSPSSPYELALWLTLVVFALSSFATVGSIFGQWGLNAFLGLGLLAIFSGFGVLLLHLIHQDDRVHRAAPTLTDKPAFFDPRASGRGSGPSA